jgi:hypothetical protein
VIANQSGRATRFERSSRVDDGAMCRDELGRVAVLYDAEAKRARRSA